MSNPDDKLSEENRGKAQAQNSSKNYEYGVEYQYGIAHKLSTQERGNHIHVSFQLITDVNKAVLRYAREWKAPARINYSDGSVREFAYDDRGLPTFIREESGQRWTRTSQPDERGFANWTSDGGEKFYGAAFVSDSGVYGNVDADGLLCLIGTDNKHSYAVAEASGDPLATLKLTESAKPPQEPANRQQVRALLARLFRSLDRDGDGVIRKTDLDAAVTDDTMRGDQSRLIAMLKLNFDKLSQYQSENEESNFASWLKANFTRLLALKAGDSLSMDEVVALSDLISQQKAVEASTTPAAIKPQLYTSAHPLKSITPQAVRQGTIGDCVFLAALASAAASNPQTIFQMIHDNKDGTFTVNFPGDPDRAITVTQPTSTELILYAQSSEFGIWAAVLEKAYGQYLAAHGQLRSKIPTENISARDCMFESLDLLTGQMGRWERMSAMPDFVLTHSLASAFRERRAIVAGSQTGGANGRTADAGIPGQHAYSVLAYDAESATITLRNPWGEQRQPGKAGEGTFKMSVSAFRRNFAYVYYEVWAPRADVIDAPEAGIRSALVATKNKRRR